MIAYVAGFMFRRHPITGFRQIALVLKQKPEFQKGKLNGIGGKVEEDENPIDAMTREFEEETGCLTLARDWRLFCTLTGADISWAVHFFVCKSGERFNPKTTEEEEEIMWVNLSDLEGKMSYEVLTNLQWLIPLALDNDEVFATVVDPTPQ